MWNAVLVSLLTILLVWVYKVVNWVWLEPRRIERFLRKQGFNGNPYRLLYGDSKESAEMYREAHSKPLGLHEDIVPRVMPFIVKTINKYGKNSFGWIGPRPRVYISDPDLMRDVLTRHQHFQKDFRTTNKVYKLLVGGLVEFEEEKWAKHRGQLNPAFHLDKLKTMAPTLMSCVDDILDGWKAQVEKEGKDGTGVVDVFHCLEEFTGAAVTRALFSHPYDAEMKNCFYLLRGMALMANIAVKTFTIPGSAYLPMPIHTKAKKMEAEVRASFRKMINDRIKARRAGEPIGRDLFDWMLEDIYDEKKAKHLDVEAIVDDSIGNLKLFYFAGYETASALLVWIMVNLSLYQDYQTKARDEVRKVLGNRKNITAEDLNQMKIIHMIVYEVLRLYPPVFELSRVVEEETKLGPFTIPKNILIQLPVAMLHRNKDIWGEDAQVFRPERFAEGVLKAANGKAALMPFGWGPRICMGQNFAIMEVKMFVAKLLQTFTWELSPAYIHAPYAAYTTQAQYGAPLILHRIDQ